jgi:transposase
MPNEETDQGTSAQRRDAQDDVLIEALAHGLSYRDAGERAGVTSRTVQRRMDTPEFRARVSSRLTEVTSATTGRLTHAAEQAIDTLVEELRNGERSADRVRAASQLLGFGIRFRREHELEARLREVEARLGLGSGSGLAELPEDWTE